MEILTVTNVFSFYSFIEQAMLFIQLRSHVWIASDRFVEIALSPIGQLNPKDFFSATVVTQILLQDIKT